MPQRSVLRETRSRSQVKYDVKSENTTTLDEKVLCPKHDTYVLQLYCAFCDKPICEKCKDTVHTPHLSQIKGYDELVMAANRKRNFIQKLHYERTENILPIIKGKIVENTENISKLINDVKEAIRKYKTYAKSHRDKLIVSEEEWIEEITYQSLKYKKLMEEKILYLKKMLFDYHSTLSATLHELESSSQPEVLFSFAVWRSKLEFLLPPIWPVMKIMVNQKLAIIPDFGPIYFQKERTMDKNCSVEFVYKIEKPLVYSRIYDTKLPLQKALFRDENAKISIASADDTYISFGEYIVVYTHDNRRTTKPRYNIKCKRIVSVRENVIDVSCGKQRNLFYLVKSSVNKLDAQFKSSKCFQLDDLPSALCVSKIEPIDIFVGFHDAGIICNYDVKGELKMRLVHPDVKMVYRPRHMTLNTVNDIVFSDDTSNVTILDANGIWKGMIGPEAGTGSGPLRPSGIACAPQRHVYVIDNNVFTQLQIFDENGRYLQTAVFKNLKDAYVLDIDRTCDVWIAFKDGNVRLYRPEYFQRYSSSV